jgi:hypothetical protein
MASLRRIKTVAAFLALALSMGCCQSTQPLSDEQQSPPDLRLIGTWRPLHESMPSDLIDVVVSRVAEDSNLLRYGYHIRGQRDPISTEEAFFVTKIGDLELGTVVYTRGQETGCLFFRYEIREADFLGLWGPNKKFFAEAVERGELQGFVRGPSQNAVGLTDTIENLRNFIQKHGERCFVGESQDESSVDHPTVYRRVKAD